MVSHLIFKFVLSRNIVAHQIAATTKLKGHSWKVTGYSWQHSNQSHNAGLSITFILILASFSESLEQEAYIFTQQLY